MNKWQKGVLGNRVEADEKVLKKIKKAYVQAEKDIDDKIAQLLGRTDTENLQSIIYQVEYQKALKSQIQGILDNMNANQFDDISKYLTESYENGFVGTVYDLHGQGIPVIFPIDQEQVVRALKTNSKLSKNLWGSLYDRNSALQRKLRSELSRGIVQGYSYDKITKNISSQMGIAYNNVARIVRTESHRIANEAAMDAQYKAKEKGADVVKQWDAALDGRTRPSHRIVDGEIAELEEKFSNGLSYPGEPSGPAAEVVNCRCALLQRAKWALDEDELNRLQERAKFFGLDKNDNFEEFKTKYLRELDNNGKSIYNGNTVSSQKKPFTKVKVEDIPPMDEKRFKLMKSNLERNGVKVIQDSNGDAFLKHMKAEALTLSDGSGIIFHSGRIPSASAMFEETIHVTQIRTKGMLQSIGDKDSTIEYLSREIEANKKVLEHKRQYGLTEKDVESVKENLEFYYKQMREVNSIV